MGYSCSLWLRPNESTNPFCICILQPQCGNGILEPGEECDTPGDSTCCDPVTCQFQPGAVCGMIGVAKCNCACFCPSLPVGMKCWEGACASAQSPFRALISCALNHFCSAGGPCCDENCRYRPTSTYVVQLFARLSVFPLTTSYAFVRCLGRALSARSVAIAPTVSVS